MDILLTNRDMGLNGMATFVAHVGGYLVERGHRVTVLAAPGGRAGEMRRAGIRVVTCPLYFNWQARPLAAWIRRQGFDVVNAHARRQAEISLAAAELAGVPFFITLHGPAPFKRMQPVFDRSRLVQVMNENNLAYFRQAVPDERLHLARLVVPWERYAGARVPPAPPRGEGEKGRTGERENGLPDPDERHDHTRPPNPPEVGEEPVSAHPEPGGASRVGPPGFGGVGGASLPPAQFRAVYCSRLSPLKGPLALAFLQAVDILADEIPGLEAHVLGGGKLLAEARRLGHAVNRRHGRPICHVAGPTTDPTPVMARSEVAVGAGYVAVEALASGCQVIGAGFAGCWGLVTPGNFASAVGENFGDNSSSKFPTSAEAMVEHLRRAYAGRDSVARQQVRTLAEREFSLACAGERIEAAFLRAVDGWKSELVNG